MPRARIMMAFCLAAALALSACAGKNVPDSAEVDWKLTPGAHAIYHYFLLEEAKRLSDPQIGEYAVEQLLEQPNLPPAFYYDAASFFWQNSDLPSARQVLIRGLEEYPDKARMALMLAQVYYAEEDLDAAAKVLRDYLSRNPDDVDSRQDLADVLILNKHYDEALRVLDKIPASKRTPTIRYYKAKAHAGMGDQDKAISILKSIVRKDPKFFEAWAELAYIYELRNDFANAEKTYQQILTFGDSSQELWLRLVELNLKLKSPDKALSLVKRGPEALSYHLASANRFMDAGYYDHAERVLLPWLLKTNAPSEIFFYLSVVEFEGRKNLQKALEYLERIPKDDQYYDRSLRYRTHLLFELGRGDEALALAREARERYPDDKEFWLLEARLLEDQDQVDESEALFQESLEKWPEDTEILYSLGVLYEREERQQEAFKIMERILEVDPEHSDALNYVGYTLADRGEDLDVALDMVTRALRDKPDNGFIIDSLAWVHYRMGDLDKAWTEIQRAVEFEDDDPIIWEHYGDIAADKGLPEEARKAYTRSLDLEPKNRDAVAKKLQALP